MEKVKVADEVWDIKKIFIFIMVVGIVAFGLKTYVLDNNISTAPPRKSSVAGVSTQNVNSNVQNISPSQEIKQGVEQKINDLKQEVNNLNVVEVATSTAAVQKVLNDFKNLQNLPQSQCRQVLSKICDGL